MATQEHKRNKYKDEKEIFEIYRKYSKRTL